MNPQPPVGSLTASTSSLLPFSAASTPGRFPDLRCEEIRGRGSAGHFGHDKGSYPDSSPRSRVLPSVPGTQEAQDAVLLAQVPNTAVVNRAQAEAHVKVQYDGVPKFQPIEGTSLTYASNTHDKIIQVGDLYYIREDSWVQ